MIYLIDKIALSNRLKIYGFDRRSPRMNVDVVSMQFRNAADFLSHFSVATCFFTRATSEWAAETTTTTAQDNLNPGRNETVSFRLNKIISENV